MLPCTFSDADIHNKLENPDVDKHFQLSFDQLVKWAGYVDCGNGDEEDLWFGPFFITLPDWALELMPKSLQMMTISRMIQNSPMNFCGFGIRAMFTPAMATPDSGLALHVVLIARKRTR